MFTGMAKLRIIAERSSVAHRSSLCHRSVIDPTLENTAAPPRTIAQGAVHPGGVVRSKTFTPTRNAITEANTHAKYVMKSDIRRTITGDQAQLVNLVFG